ncbi:MAG: hypothetical protein WKG07_11980 [Hymenobacter sp.]
MATNNAPELAARRQAGLRQESLDRPRPAPSADGQSLTLTYLSKDGEEGYPGTLDVTVVYTLTDDDAPAHRLHRPPPTRPRSLNLTNHAYFNLSQGAAQGRAGPRC